MFMVPKSESIGDAGKKIYAVKDISPCGEFIIEILDTEHNPIKDTDFGVSVDDGKAENKRTDDEGKIRITRPNNKFDLYLNAKGRDRNDLAEEFVVKIVDLEHSPIKDAAFNVAVDSGQVKNKRTDDEGLIRIAKPKTEFDISFTN